MLLFQHGDKPLLRRVISMLKFFKTVNEELVNCDTFEEGVWVNLLNPTEEEINLVVESTGIEAELLRPALDGKSARTSKLKTGLRLYWSTFRLLKATG
jgi:magnesium transporter